MSARYNELALPKWAQRRLTELRAELDRERADHARTRLAHAVLCDPERDWFTIPGPGPTAGELGVYHLWYGIQHRACSLFVGDVVLVGRARKREELCQQPLAST